MDHSKNHSQHLGVNKLGKNIRKSPLHQPSFAANAKPQYPQQQAPPAPQPQVYNISKKDFRSIVQQLTGTPSRDPPAGSNPAPLQNPNNPAFFPRPFPSASGAGPAWADSPVTAYMRYLESSDTPRQPQPQPPPFPSPGLLPSPPFPAFPSPRANAPPPLLPSPGSQFVAPSPTAFLNMLSPKSPYPLLSPGFQYPPLLTPNFAFSPMGQAGILGPGPQPPPSPGLFFPQSPSGFLPILSPRWRDM
uniref:Protein HAIKU1 n=1 Tax=Elaeis guineensis var. tenera TaxID=51953 RepID=A0A8N4IGH0_ELAGV|nr:protein HAIKU1 [Elaeis guineensis]